MLAKPPKKKKRKYISVYQAVVDDESLNANVKTFYRDISKMCRFKGYCWAYNKYFAERYQVSTRTIGRWIAKLVKRGYITSEIKRDKKLERQLRVNKAILDIKNKENESNEQFSDTNGNIK